MTTEEAILERCFLCKENAAEQTDAFIEPRETGAPGYEVQYHCHACNQNYEVYVPYNRDEKSVVTIIPA